MIVTVFLILVGSILKKLRFQSIFFLDFSNSGSQVSPEATELSEG